MLKPEGGHDLDVRGRQGQGQGGGAQLVNWLLV